MSSIPSLTRRRLLHLSGLAAGAGLLGGCATPPAGAPQQASSGGGAAPGSEPAPGSEAASQAQYSTIRSTAVSWIWAPFLVAEDQGYFGDEGVDHEGVVAGQGVVANIVISGDADLVVGSPMDAMKATAVGQPLISFCNMVNTFATNVVVSGDAFDAAGLTDDSSAEERAAAMQGLRLASTGVASAPDLLIRYIASTLGNLDASTDVRIIAIQGGGSAMLAAVDNDQIDGMAISSPISDQGVEQLGMRYLFNMPEDPIASLTGFPYIMASCRQDFLEANPDVIAGYCRAIQRSLNFIQAEKDQFRDIMSGLFTDVSPEIFEQSFEDNYAIYATQIVPGEEQFDQAKGFVVSAFEIEDRRAEADAAQALTFNDAWDAGYAQDAVDEVGDSY